MIRPVTHPFDIVTIDMGHRCVMLFKLIFFPFLNRISHPANSVRGVPITFPPEIIAIVIAQEGWGEGFRKPRNPPLATPLNIPLLM